MLNWIVLIRTGYLNKMDLALNNQQRLICHKTQPTKPNQIKSGNWELLVAIGFFSLGEISQDKLWIQTGFALFKM